jgi:uncharacterized membrane protein YhhN
MSSNLNISMTKHFNQLSLVYLAISVVYLIGLVFMPPEIVHYLKFCLIPVLIIAVAICPSFAQRTFLLLALAFSWVGDIIISYAPLSELYFILGLGSFLIAHIWYIILFRNSINKTVQSRGYLTWAWSILGVYFIGLLLLLIPHLGNMLIPVLIYAVVISTMLIFAIRGWSHWPIIASQWALIGACSFVLSDSLLAINKFYTALPYASVWIMATYQFAQWAMVRGIIGAQKVSALIP